MKAFPESKLSVVTAVYKNASTLEALVERVLKVAQGQVKELEHIFVNDGSPDESGQVLRRLAARYPHIKVVQLVRNFGQHTAIFTAFQYATGDYIFWLDADLEEAPEELPRFFEKLAEGYEIAVGKRTNTRTSFFKTLTAKLYTSIFNRLSEYALPDNVTSMRLMTARYKDFLLCFREKPFIGGMSSWIGLPFGLVPVEWVDQGRKSSYTLRKLLSHARAGLIGFSTMPLRFALACGLLLCGVSVLFALSVMVARLSGMHILTGYTSLILIIVFLMGAQFIYVGLVGEYVGEIFLATKGRPVSLVYDTINIEGDARPCAE